MVVVLVARRHDSQHDLSELSGIYENGERKVMEEKNEKPRQKQETKRTDKHLDERGITTLDEIFPGFGAWYRARYDEDGNLRPDARVLRLRGEP